MKRGTPRHPKIDKLMRLLNIGRATAVGILSIMWEWASEFAADGDLSRYREELHAFASWDGDAAALVPALIGSNWLDESNGKLLIHDWPDHCEATVHRKLIRKRIRFANGAAPTRSYGTPEERTIWDDVYSSTSACNTGEIEPKPSPAHTQPLPSPTQPKGVQGEKVVHGIGTGLGGVAKREARKVGVDPGETDLRRMVDVQNLLRGYGVSQGMVAELSIRRDITADRVSKAWQAVTRDASADDKIAVLVHRLRKPQK